MRNLIVILTILFFSNYGFSQIAFYKMYTDNGADFGQGIVQLEDSSYVITGASSSFGGASTQAYLLKLDSLGNYIWSNSYGGVESEWGRRVLYKQNFGFFICGFTNSIGNGGYDFYLAKVDEMSNLEWETSIGGSGWEKVHDAALTADTGTIMVGETSSNPTDNLDIFIVRTDINGDTLWTKTIGGPGDDYASSIRKYTDTTYVVGGSMYNVDSLKTKGYLMYMHIDGTVYWQQTFGNNGEYKVNDLTIINNEILAVGESDRLEGNEADQCFMLMNMGGGYLGDFSVQGAGIQKNTFVTQYAMPNEVYITVEFDDAWSVPEGTDIKIARYDFPINWQTNFLVYHEKPDVSGQVISTSDGGVVFVGYSTGVVSGGNEVTVVKIGPSDLFPAYPEVVSNLVIVPEMDIVLNVNAFPNPVSENITISTDYIQFKEIVLYNNMGKEVIRNQYFKDSEIDVSRLPEGYYILEILGDNVYPVRKKIVVKH